mmetsp:Transcript_3805/g.7411  ORF Transcript_3805/g.7411 Transcript_3805/m.7411 type:complete len:256 (+) Transcript_3805:667-1434(+)
MPMPFPILMSNLRGTTCTPRPPGVTTRTFPRRAWWRIPPRARWPSSPTLRRRTTRLQYPTSRARRLRTAPRGSPPPACATSRTAPRLRKAPRSGASRTAAGGAARRPCAPSRRWGTRAIAWRTGEGGAASATGAPSRRFDPAGCARGTGEARAATWRTASNPQGASPSCAPHMEVARLARRRIVPLMSVATRGSAQRTGEACAARQPGAKDSLVQSPPKASPGTALRTEAGDVAKSKDAQSRRAVAHADVCRMAG